MLRAISGIFRREDSELDSEVAGTSRLSVRADSLAAVEPGDKRRLVLELDDIWEVHKRGPPGHMVGVAAVRRCWLAGDMGAAAAAIALPDRQKCNYWDYTGPLCNRLRIRTFCTGRSIGCSGIRCRNGMLKIRDALLVSFLGIVRMVLTNFLDWCRLCNALQYADAFVARWSAHANAVLVIVAVAFRTALI